MITDDDRAQAREKYPSKPRVTFARPGVEASAPWDYMIDLANLRAGSVIFRRVDPSISLTRVGWPV